MCIRDSSSSACIMRRLFLGAFLLLCSLSAAAAMLGGGRGAQTLDSFFPKAPGAWVPPAPGLAVAAAGALAASGGGVAVCVVASRRCRTVLANSSFRLPLPTRLLVLVWQYLQVVLLARPEALRCVVLRCRLCT